MHTNCTPETIHPPHAPSRVALGTWALAGDGPWGYGPVAEGALDDTVRAALDAGCRWVDTAGMFGNGGVESRLGALLAHHPQVAVTTRVGVGTRHNHPAADFSARVVLEGCRVAAQRLTRPPETVLLHTPSTGVLKDRIAMRALIEARDAGLCRTIGASVFEPEQAHIAMDVGAQVICVPHNPANRQMEAVMAEAARNGVIVQVREVLHNGRLTGSPRNPHTFARHDVRRQWPPRMLDALDGIRARIAAACPEYGVTAAVIGYALGRPSVSRVVVGCRSPEQARAAFAARPLDAPFRVRLEAALYGPPAGRERGAVVDKP
ncbi:MAG: aldo/keto reductase [Nitrospirota bacterium]|nr:aldo/keto reductase [Nitrospirota bacterium]